MDGGGSSLQQAFHASEKHLEIPAARWLPLQPQPRCLTHVPRLVMAGLPPPLCFSTLCTVCLECPSLFPFFTSFLPFSLSPQWGLACSPQRILFLLSFSFLAVLGIEPKALHIARQVLFHCITFPVSFLLYSLRQGSC